jgi:ribosome biogenesis GTPase / thiamine phosphate phosphatase
MNAGENIYNLEELGWDGHFASGLETLEMPGVIPGRVVTIEKDICQVMTASGELAAQLSGRFRYEARGDAFPAIGDWLAVRALPGEAKAIIHAVLPRKSKFSRQISGGRQRTEGGRTEEQIVAANVDTVFLVNGLDGGRSLSVRRIERYLAIAWASGATPVIVLNKADLCPDTEPFMREVERAAYGIPTHTVSAVTGAGMEALQQYLIKGSTVALLGSSGVGKSALINALLGEERLATGEVRASDGEGRHTTTRRELILLPGGGAVIDTPGMREIQVWGDEQSLNNAFEDIAALAAGCRFKDCRHNAEPDCAVREALRSGALDAKHFKSYLQLQREMHHLAARQEGKAALMEKMRWKQISKIQKRLKHEKDANFGE